MNNFILIAGEYINSEKLESFLIKENNQEGTEDNWIVMCFLKNPFAFEKFVEDETIKFLSKQVMLVQVGFTNIESAEFWISNNFDSIKLQGNKFVIKNSVNSLYIGINDATQKYHAMLVMDSIGSVNKKEEEGGKKLTYEVIPNVLLSQSFETLDEANNWVLNNFNNSVTSLLDKAPLRKLDRVLQ